MIVLVAPHEMYKKQYLDMLSSWKIAGEEPQPWVLAEDCSDFESFVRRLLGFSRGIGVTEGFVPSSTFWIYEDISDTIAGAVNIRHFLNDTLLRFWGNIGYGIRPDMRRKGCATRSLELALEKCRVLGMDKVLLSCNKDNIASARVIINNGGVLENEMEYEGGLLQRYWIDL